MSKQHNLWALVGAAMAGISGYVLWNLKIRDDRLFEEAFNEFGFPRSKEQMRAFWDHARSQRIEDDKKATENALLIHQLAEYVDTSQRLKKAYDALWDKSCDVEVAVWNAINAIRTWHKQFNVQTRWAEVHEQEFIEAVQKWRDEEIQDAP